VHKTLQTFIEELLLKVLGAKQISVQVRPPQPVTQFFIQSDPTHKHYRQAIGKQADIVFKLRNGDLIQNPDLPRLFFIDFTIGCPWTFSHGKTYLNAPDAADSQANNKLTTEYDPLFDFNDKGESIPPIINKHSLIILESFGAPARQSLWFFDIISIQLHAKVQQAFRFKSGELTY
jgi:hypothetical protein